MSDTTETGNGLAAARVLVVDDIPEARVYLARLIALDAGFEVVGTAQTGLEAIEAIERLEPDVVLMDVLMPELSGIDATARIRHAGHTLPIIMMSVLDDAETLGRARRAGAAEFLVKPFSADELFASLSAVTGRPFDPTTFVRPDMAALETGEEETRLAVRNVPAETALGAITPDRPTAMTAPPSKTRSGPEPLLSAADWAALVVGIVISLLLFGIDASGHFLDVPLAGWLVIAAVFFGRRFVSGHRR